MQNFIRITIPFERNSLNDTHDDTHGKPLVNTSVETNRDTHGDTHGQTIINLIREDKNVTRD